MKIQAQTLALFAPLILAQLALGQNQDPDIPPKDMPRMPGARLLVGYPPQKLAVTTGDETIVLPPDFLTKTGAADGTPIYPTISQNGNLVALARWRGGFPEQIVTVAIYSIAAKKWTEYRTGQYSGSVAISPDGTKLAFEAGTQSTSTEYIYPITVLDLETGGESAGPEVPIAPSRRSPRELSFPWSLSWSPDGKRLAFGDNAEISVWDIATQQARKIAEGSAPVWSPNGEWIAFLNSPKDPLHSNCSIIHPDGSGERELVALRGKRLWWIISARVFLEEPVWSPDSTHIMLNEMADGEKWTMNIDLLDIATGKLKKVMKNKVPVYAWAAVKTK